MAIELELRALLGDAAPPIAEALERARVRWPTANPDPTFV